MYSKDLKKYIINNNLIPHILDSLQCHNIVNRGNYISAANPDGDNVSAINVYTNDYLTTVDYTRDITKYSTNHSSADLFTLIQFFKNCSFIQALKYVCDIVGLDYYHNFETDLPASLKLTQVIFDEMKGNTNGCEDIVLTPISENILTYYYPYVNDLFSKDNISYSTQKLFEVGYDGYSNRITIPIRDEIGTLVGIKGRLFSADVLEGENKYIYLEPCPKGQILYGLDKTYEFIQNKGVCFIGESEKFVMQMWNSGYFNSVSTGGSKLTNTQIEKLTRLCCDLCFCFDKDITKNELCNIASNFIDGVKIYALIDKENILSKKESPSDNKEKLEYLITNNMYLIKS